MIHVFALLFSMIATGGVMWEIYVPKTLPYHDGSQRAVLWFDCEHEAAERYVAGLDGDRSDWLALGAAECVARRGFPAEADLGRPNPEE